MKKTNIRRGSVVQVKIGDTFFRGIAISKEKNGWYIISKGSGNVWHDSDINVLFHISGKKTGLEYREILNSIQEFQNNK